MMKRLRTIVYALVCAMSLTGCISSSDFSVKNVGEVKMTGLTSLSVKVEVENRSGMNVGLAGGEFRIDYNGEEVGSIVLAPTAKVHRHSTEEVDVRLRFDFNNPLSALAVVGAASSQPDKITLTGYVKVKSGMASKKKRYENIPVSKFISTFENKFAITE